MDAPTQATFVSAIVLRKTEGTNYGIPWIVIMQYDRIAEV